MSLNLTTIKSPNHSSRGASKVDAIVIHDTASMNINGTIEWLKNKQSGVSYHYIVGRGGEIIQLVDEHRKAWHAGAAHLHGDKASVNGRSIGIALVNDGETPYTYPQAMRLVELVTDIRKRRKISIYNILGHKDVAMDPVGRKSDPCSLFPWEAFYAELLANEQLEFLESLDVI